MIIDDLPGYQQEAVVLSDRARKTHPGHYNVAYGDNVVQVLDVFAPENPDSLPVLMDVHSGGWRAGS